MPPLDWEHELVELFWEQHKLPSAYSFKRATVPAISCIVIEAYCSECGAQAGVIEEEPGKGKSAKLQWETNDSGGVFHEKNRPLQGKKRGMCVVRFNIPEVEGCKNDEPR